MTHLYPGAPYYGIEFNTRNGVESNPVGGNPDKEEEGFNPIKHLKDNWKGASLGGLVGLAIGAVIVLTATTVWPIGVTVAVIALAVLLGIVIGAAIEAGEKEPAEEIQNATNKKKPVEVQNSSSNISNDNNFDTLSKIFETIEDKRKKTKENSHQVTDVGKEKQSSHSNLYSSYSEQHLEVLLKCNLKKIKLLDNCLDDLLTCKSESDIIQVVNRMEDRPRKILANLMNYFWRPEETDRTIYFTLIGFTDRLHDRTLTSKEVSILNNNLFSLIKKRNEINID